MDLDLFESIIEQVAPITEMVCFHLMGEPLLHPKLPQMLEICSKHQVPVFFVSNGVLLTEARAQLLLHPILRQVNFSLHSYLDNHPGADPRPYLEKIFKYVDRALTERPELYLNFRLWNLQSPQGQTNENVEMRRLIEEKYQVALVSNPDVRVTKSQRIRGRLYVHYDTEFTWPSLDLPVLGSAGTCYGLRNHFGILADGTVVPCCLDKEGVLPLGKIPDQSVMQVLDSEKAKTMLQGFLKGELRESLCQRCDYVTRFGGESSRLELSRQKASATAASSE